MDPDMTQAVTPEAPAVDGQSVSVPEQQDSQPTTTWDEASATAEIKRLRAEAAKYRNERKAAEEAAAKAAEAEAKRRGEFEQLYEGAKAELDGLRPLKERMDALQAQTTERNRAAIDKLPEAMRTLVPDYDDPFKLDAWLQANAATLAKPQAPSLDAGAGGNGSGTAVNEAVERDRAIRLGLNPDIFVKALKG